MHSNYLLHYYRLLLSHPFPGSRFLCWLQGVFGASSGGHGTRQQLFSRGTSCTQGDCQCQLGMIQGGCSNFFLPSRSQLKEAQFQLPTANSASRLCDQMVSSCQPAPGALCSQAV